MKKLTIMLLIILLIMPINGCSNEKIYHRFKHAFFNTFDTIIDITVYASSEEEAIKYFKYAEDRFNELHRLYDKYNEYDNINNVYSINKNAGLKPVKVKKELYELIKLSIDYYNNYSDETDISMGKVLNIWSNWRDEVEAKNIPNDKKHLPNIEQLKEANKFTGIDHIIFNETEHTIFIDNSKTQIDLGAIAKGYATEIIARELEEMGLSSAIISAGGNVRIIGKPLDRMRDKWGVAIRNPKKLDYIDDSNIPDYVDIIFANDLSVVTSGDYQRFLDIEGKRFHHLIDKDTLFPGDYFSSVTIVYKDSGLADFISTAVYLMPYDRGRELIDSIDQMEAYWVFRDGEILYTEGLKPLLKSQGASGGK